MDPDRSLFDWLGHYLSLIVLSSLLGIGAALAFLSLATPPYEAWSVIIQSEDRIAPRELGPLAQSVFVTEDVYGPAMAELGLDMSPSLFLREHAELRPVPETDALIVIGRSDDREQAERISDAMMRSLVETFRVRGLTVFTIFDQAAPVQRQAGPPVILAFGGMIGFWLGVAGAIVHFRLRRPILSLARAVAISGPDHVATVRGRRPRWLGVLRRPRRWKRGEATRSALDRLAARRPDGSTPRVIVATAHPDGVVPRLEEALSRGTTGSPRGVLVADAGTREETLTGLLRYAAGSGDLDLVWVS